MIRLLVTLLVPIAAWAAGFVRLPGLDFPLPHGTDATSLSVVALGLTPALSGFVVVELVAAAVPRWRALRIGGPLERLKLRRASLLLAIALAIVQAYFISVWLLRPNPFYTVEVSPLVLIATLIGGTGFMLALAWLCDRWGLTSGFSMLLLIAAARLVWALKDLRPNDDFPPFDLVLFGTIFVGYVGATAWILRKPSKLRLPVCGLVPLVVAHGFLFVALWAGTYFQFSVPAEGTLAYALLFVALVALQAFAYGRRFTRPLARFGITDVKADLGASIFYVVWMSIPWLMVLRIPLAIDAFTVATAVAVVFDIVAELRARRKEPTLVDVWPIHEVALLRPALDALQKAGIFAHARAVHHRSLLQLFGPFVPIDLYVPGERAAEAQEILGQLYEM